MPPSRWWCPCWQFTARPARRLTTRTPKWQSFKADTSAKMQGLRGRIERQRDERDVKAAERDAEAAEDDAANALDYAAWAIDQAEVAVLDAADARAWADARAAASPPS